MTTLLLVLVCSVAQPYALHGDDGVVTSIVDEAGWCTARPDGPRIGSTVSVEGFATDLFGDGTFHGEGWITLDGRERYIGFIYFPDFDQVSAAWSDNSSFMWRSNAFGKYDLAWDGIPIPPDTTGQGYADCRMTLDVGPLVHRLPGDSNDDGRFTTADLVLVFTAGEYEDGVPRNSTWATGDWNADREFRSNDLVAVMQTGAYEQPAAAMVPEPTAVVLLAIGCVLSYGEACRRSKRA